MHLGFYSEAGRKDVAAARSFIADRGFGSTPAEIRRCRQELLKTPLATVTRFTDFFSTSECRDLLFHVHESRMTIPAINAFIGEHRLKFLGFEFDAPVAHQLRNRFTASGWSLTDLDRWHEFETENPDTFSGAFACARDDSDDHELNRSTWGYSVQERTWRIRDAIYNFISWGSFPAGRTPAPAVRAYDMPYDPYPWCAVYSGDAGGASNCGFLTIDQCRATVSGIGGSCEPNQFYNPRPAARARKHKSQG